VTLTLRLFAAISFVWIVGFFLLIVTGGTGGEPFGLSFGAARFAASLGGELVLAVGILALVATASHRQFVWFALFALLLGLLHVLTLIIFQPFADVLTLFEVPMGLLGRFAWVVLLPALIPGTALAYTIVCGDGRRVVAEQLPSVDALSHEEPRDYHQL
jgi:hypothetical protein